MPDLTASPGRAPGPGPMANNINQQGGMRQGQSVQAQGGLGGSGGLGGAKDPVMLQGDFRKVSGISSEIFRQIEAVENDHDKTTAEMLKVHGIWVFKWFIIKEKVLTRQC